MRKLRMMLVAGVAMLSLAAVGPAMASEFVSTGGPANGKGEEQELHLGPFRITCAAVRAKGGATTPLASETFNTSLTFQKCTTLAQLGGNEIHLKTKFLTKVDVEYHANGFLETGGEFEEVEGSAKLAGGQIEVKVNPLNSKEAASGKSCIITLPTQTVPKKAITKPGGDFESALYSTEEEEKGKRTFNELLIENEWKSIQFSYTGGQCESFSSSEEERHSGTYVGEILEFVPHGSIEYVEN